MKVRVKDVRELLEKYSICRFELPTSGLHKEARSFLERFG